MKDIIDGSTRLLGLFADPWVHSNSPKMHNAAFKKLGINMVYLSFQVNEKNIKESIDALKTFKMVGANLSMPNKKVVIPYLDKLSPEAKIIGAVNTIVNDNGVLTGYMTDGTGYVESLKQEGIDIKDKKITVVGAGGAATAICIQSALEGAKEISIFNRTEENAKVIGKKIDENTDARASSYNLDNKNALRREMEESHIFVNTTNIGMGKYEEQTIIQDTDYFTKDLIVVDIIYNPEKTKMLKMAEDKGCKTINGLGMLINQGAVAFELWTGEKMPIDYIKNLWAREKGD